MNADPHPKVDQLFAFLGEDSAGMEHIMEGSVGGEPLPLMSRDMEALMKYRQIAQAAAGRHGLTVRLVCYTGRKEIDVFKPDRVAPDTNPKTLEADQTTHDAECIVDAQGRCVPCAARLGRVLGKLVDYIRVVKEQREGGKICPLCEAVIADESVAEIVSKIGTSGTRTEFLQTMQTLMALLQEKLGVTEWPKTDAAVRETIGRMGA